MGHVGVQLPSCSLASFWGCLARRAQEGLGDDGEKLSVQVLDNLSPRGLTILSYSTLSSCETVCK